MFSQNQNNFLSFLFRKMPMYLPSVGGVLGSIVYLCFIRWMKSTIHIDKSVLESLVLRAWILPGFALPAFSAESLEESLLLLPTASLMLPPSPTKSREQSGNWAKNIFLVVKWLILGSPLWKPCNFLQLLQDPFSQKHWKMDLVLFMFLQVK